MEAAHCGGETQGHANSTLALRQGGDTRRVSTDLSAVACHIHMVTLNILLTCQFSARYTNTFGGIFRYTTARHTYSAAA